MSHTPDDSAGVQSPNAGSDHGSRARSLDSVFEILVAERRRNALYVLFRRSGPVEFDSLADEVASLEGADPQRVAASLHNVHLPKLADAGLARYDAEAGTVRLADHSELFRRYLTSAAEDERRPLRRASESARLSEF